MGSIDYSSCGTSECVCMTFALFFRIQAAILDQGFLMLASTMLLNVVFFLEAVEAFLMLNTFVDALFLAMTRFLEIELLKEVISSSSC